MSAKLTYNAFESRYRNKQYIGAGGFGRVYKVFDHAKNHYVALKVSDVRPEWDKFTLQKEVELVNRLPLHRNIARYDACYRFDTGFTGMMDFAVLRFYEYGNLEQFLKKEDLSLEDKPLIIKGILNGVALLHKNDVIHRDLKAQNILLHREDGVWTPKITDFGLSRQTGGENTITNSAIGLSYAYAAPEQIQNGKIYKNVDLWATGVIIYRILTGELPFRGRSNGENKSTQSQLEVSRKIVNLELPAKLENIPSPFREMIKRCFVFAPEERAQTAEELLGMLMESENINLRQTPQNGPASDEDKTEILPAGQNKMLDENSSHFANGNQSDTTEVMPGRQQTPAVGRPEGEKYGTPKTNVTQVFRPKTRPTDRPAEEVTLPPALPPVSRFQPKTGEPKRNFFPLRILCLFVLIGAGAGAWWYQNNPDFSTPDVEDKIDDTTAIIVNRYETTEEKIETAQQDPATLGLLLRTLQQEIDKPENRSNYRPEYLTAKIHSYRKDNRSVVTSLKKAAHKAIEARDAKSMLADMKAEERKVFLSIRLLQKGKYWKPIIEALEKSQ